jgi:hypothetical protein
VVLLIGSMMLWSEAVVRGPRLVITIASAALVYLISLGVMGRGTARPAIAWWPFAVAGFAGGAVGELINAKFLITRELLIAGLTGIAIGTAQWTALRVWIRLRRGGAGE